MSSDPLILDDEDDRPRARRPVAENSSAGTLGNFSFSLGIVAFFLCGLLLGPVAIAMGILSLAKKRDDESGAMAITGVALGIGAAALHGLAAIAFFSGYFRF